MAIDLCQACGDEHETPRGAKCKVIKAKVVWKATIKVECVEEEDVMGVTGGVEETVDKMLELSLVDVGETGKTGKWSHVKSECEEVEPDEEELELRRRLRDWVLEKCKVKLQAAPDCE